jgi:RNase P subunit RPR2
MLINKNGGRKQLLGVKDFICENCESKLFTSIGYAKIIQNKHYSYDPVGIKCAMCGEVYLNNFD